MKRKILLILAFFLFFLNLPGQQTYRNFQVFIPEFNPLGDPFQISTVLKLEDIDVDRVEISIISGTKLSIEKVAIKNPKFEGKLNIQEELYDDEVLYSYAVGFNIKDLTDFQTSKPVQLIYYFKSTTAVKIDLSFRLIFYKKGQVVKTVSSSSVSLLDEIIPETVITFYKKERVAGNALSLKGNSSFKIAFSESATGENFLLELWLKLPPDIKEFLEIRDTRSDKSILKLFLNKFQIVSTEFSVDIEAFDNIFISRNSWNHFVIRYDSGVQKFLVIINDKTIFRIPANEIFDIAYSEVQFINSSKIGRMELDQIKIWDYTNSLETLLRNKNYFDYSADSSKLFLALNFDKGDFISEHSNIESFDLSIGEYYLTASSAPILSKLPEINVTTFANYNLIEWICKDPAELSKYVLQRSTDGNNFENIYSIQAFEEKEHTYGYTDSRHIEDEIVFYRLKQINQDGSVIYSPQVKIGQGENEFFQIEQNYPNPFNPTTTITVEILESDNYEITIYDIVGKKIETLHSGVLQQGIHSFSFDGSNLPSGIYFCEVKSPASSKIQKMILAK